MALSSIWHFNIALTAILSIEKTALSTARFFYV